jgi:hypothetical protein
MLSNRNEVGSGSGVSLKRTLAMAKSWVDDESARTTLVKPLLDDAAKRRAPKYPLGVRTIVPPPSALKKIAVIFSGPGVLGSTSKPNTDSGLLNVKVTVSSPLLHSIGGH